jgi:hypothetical protein
MAPVPGESRAGNWIVIRLVVDMTGLSYGSSVYVRKFSTCWKAASSAIKGRKGVSVRDPNGMIRREKCGDIPLLINQRRISIIGRLRRSRADQFT